MKKGCETCKYKEYNECRRAPPKLVTRTSYYSMLSNSDITYTEFPKVHEGMFCHEWKQKEKL